MSMSEQEFGSRILLTRSEARSISSPRYFTGKPCSYDHVDERYTSSGMCVSCSTYRNALNHRSNYTKNGDKIRERSKRKRADNPEYRKEYYAKNAERFRQYSREKRTENPARTVAQTVARRARKLKATPSWANPNEIEKIYIECRRLTEITGIVHHVDHIYPLKSRWMCGLHVETNLQILTREENLAKGNWYWPGMEWSVGEGIPL